MKRFKKFAVLLTIVCVATVMLYGFITGMQHYLVCSTFATLVENKNFEEAVEYGFKNATRYLRPEMPYGFNNEENDFFMEQLLVAQANYSYKIVKKICLLEKENKLTKADWDKDQLALTNMWFYNRLIISKNEYSSYNHRIVRISIEKKWPLNKKPLPPLYKIVTPEGELKLYPWRDEAYSFIKKRYAKQNNIPLFGGW